MGGLVNNKKRTIFGHMVHSEVGIYFSRNPDWSKVKYIEDKELKDFIYSN